MYSGEIATVCIEFRQKKSSLFLAFNQEARIEMGLIEEDK